jgi:hypothetical protein
MLALALASSLTLVLTDVQRLPLDRGEVETATETALRGSGLELRWDQAPAGAGRLLRPGDVRVILMASHPSKRDANERVLGAVFRERHEAQAIWIYVEDVRYVVEGTRRSSRAGAVRELSVAVGRVLAHEVAHILAPSHPHAEGGLMARAVGRDNLGADAAPLDADCLGAIRTALALPAAVPGAVAAEPAATPVILGTRTRAGEGLFGTLH